MKQKRKQLKEDGTAANAMGSGGIDTFDPLLGEKPTILSRIKTGIQAFKNRIRKRKRNGQHRRK